MEVETKEIAVVKGQASKALNAAEALMITTQEEMVTATDHLSKMKQVAKMIKERKEAITKPLNEALKSARDLFQPIEANLAEAERIVKGKMLSYQRDEDERISKDKNKVIDKVESGKMSVEKGIAKIEQIGTVQTSVQGKVGAIAFRNVKKYRVVDESKLPREFLMPNMSAITEALKAGKVVPGAEMYEEKVVASSSQLDADSPLLRQR